MRKIKENENEEVEEEYGMETKEKAMKYYNANFWKIMHYFWFECYTVK